MRLNPCQSLLTYAWMEFANPWPAVKRPTGAMHVQIAKNTVNCVYTPTMHDPLSLTIQSSLMPHANKLDMQNQLFAELSTMFGREVPLYDKSLAVNAVCNRALCDLITEIRPGFTVSDEQIERTSAERHGAIRIGRPDEYRWIARFFACFDMHPHNFYDMTSVGAKSQPVIATAFRSTLGPEHRVFTSLLRTDYFADETRDRIESALQHRQVFSDTAKKLIEKSETHSGLCQDDANELINEATTRIFKWTGDARDHLLYTDLVEGGFKIAADIACFNRHHLNHLTPNTFCMDLYTAAMRFRMGELGQEAFVGRAANVLTRISESIDTHWILLHFRHIKRDTADQFGCVHATEDIIKATVDALVDRLSVPELDLTKLDHAGFKDFTEGPAFDTPLLLRQDAYKALTESVEFKNPDGTTQNSTHTARFGEIEERFYATTPKGRALYDQCLASAEERRAEDMKLPTTDISAWESKHAKAFDQFPKTVPELVSSSLIYAMYEPTEAGRAVAGSIETSDLNALVEMGYVRFEGLRYEDFLPVSAAGIFASNLNQYGTATTAANKPEYTQATLEDVIGRSIINTDDVYKGIQSQSILNTYAQLKVSPPDEAQLTKEANGCPVDIYATHYVAAHAE